MPHRAEGNNDMFFGREFSRYFTPSAFISLYDVQATRAMPSPAATKLQDSSFSFGILRDDRHAATLLENIHCQVMAVTPGALFRHDKLAQAEVIDTDFVITDQPVVSGQWRARRFPLAIKRAVSVASICSADVQHHIQRHPEMSRGWV